MSYYGPMEMVLDRLEGVKPNGNGWMARCPAHDDQKASLSIRVGDSQPVVLHCHAGCDLSAILEELGLGMADILRPAASASDNGKAQTIYEYQDKSGDLLFQVIRRPGKKFFQRRPNGKGGWINNLKGVRCVPYRLPELLTTDPSESVFIPEGEKDVENLRSLGLTATCNPGGAGKWQKGYGVFLKGRDVVILSDNDDAGRKHALQVGRELIKVAGSVRVLELPSLPEKGDVSDWLAAGSTREALLDLANNAPDWIDWAASQTTEDVQDYEPLIEPYRPFPVEALPAQVGLFVDQAAKAIGCDPCYVALPLLVGFSGAIGNTRLILLKGGWTEPAILWAAIIGESGTRFGYEADSHVAATGDCRTQSTDGSIQD